MRKKFVWGFYPRAVGHIWLRLTHIWPIPNGMCKYLVKVVYFDVFNLFALFLWINVTKKKKKKPASNSSHVGKAPLYSELK